MRKFILCLTLIFVLYLFSCVSKSEVFENGMYETLIVDSCLEKVMYCRIFKDDSSFWFHEYEDSMYSSGKLFYKLKNNHLQYAGIQYQVGNNSSGVQLNNLENKCVSWYFVLNNKIENHYYPFVDFCKSKNELIKELNKYEKLGVSVTNHLIDSCESMYFHNDFKDFDSIKDEIELIEKKN